MPKVSIIIPTHNRPRLIVRAIRSILNQTFQDFEIIVVDDGTKERAEGVVTSLNDHRIVYIKHELQKGAAAARNTGLAHAKAEYIGLLDDDDEALPRRLELQVQALDEHPEVGLVFTSLELIERGRTVEKLMEKTPKEGVSKAELLKKNFIFGTTLMLRRSCLEGDIFFDESFPKNQEWDLVLRLMDRTKFLAITEKLVRAHVLEDNEHLGGLLNMPNIIRAYKMIIEKHANQYATYPQSLAYMCFLTAVLERDYGDFHDAQKDFLRAWKLTPFSLLYARHYVATFLGKAIFSFLKELKLRGVMQAGKKTYLYLFKSRIEKDRAILHAKQVISNLYHSDNRTIMIANDYIREFKKKKLFRLNKSAIGAAGDFDVLMLYVLTRIQKPNIILETGVASGRSAYVMLDALEENKNGQLYSIDLPHYYAGEKPKVSISSDGNQALDGFIPAQRSPGWLVPDTLRNRWHLFLGDSRDLLPATLQKLGTIDIFFHDSDHSYESMSFEYTMAWPHISQQGFLLSDDVKWNAAFNDFIENIKPQFHVQEEGFGIIRKLEASIR